jgi:hypothetical protein
MATRWWGWREGGGHTYHGERSGGVSREEDPPLTQQKWTVQSEVGICSVLFCFNKKIKIKIEYPLCAEVTLA